MRIELTEQERANHRGDRDWWLHRDNTLAWRAFGKALGVQTNDPVSVIDAGMWYPLIAGRGFSLEAAHGERYLQLGRFGCWEGGAMRSLDPACTYISYSVAPDGRFVDFHGWHRPRGESRIIPRNPGDQIPFLTKGELSSMGFLVRVMRRRIAQAGQANG